MTHCPFPVLTHRAAVPSQGMPTREPSSLLHPIPSVTTAAVIFATALGLFGMSTSAMATEVEIYGRADAGIFVQHLKGGSTSTEMVSGGRTTPRFGFEAREDLGNGWQAKVMLENGFKMDTGEFGSSDRLFDRRSLVALAGPYGELGLGRAGTVQSIMSPYSLGMVMWDPYAADYGFSSLASTFANTSRTDNGLYYHSPKFSGFQLGASYSMGDKGDDALEWDEKAHTLALALNYSLPKTLWLGVTYANVKAKDAGDLTMPDANLWQLGGWWKPSADWKLYAGMGYQSKFSSAAKMTRKVRLPAGKRTETFTGMSYLLGAEWRTGRSKVIGGVQYFRGTADNLIDTKLTRTIASLAYEYSLKKNVILYTAINRSVVGGQTTKDDNEYSGTQFYAGLNFNF